MFADALSTTRFLTQATFGTSPQDIETLTGTDASDWFLGQLEVSPSLNLGIVLDRLEEPDARGADGDFTFEVKQLPTELFWINAIEGEDQLRQRTAFALSQILVISHAEGGNLFTVPFTVADYQDILVENAFGNYRDLLEEVTYSPAMAFYLTYMRNAKGDPATGRMPDENYAREIMQLFTIGVVDLNADGTVRLDGDGQPIESYDNSDVTGLARVFTGLGPDTPRFDSPFAVAGPAGLSSPLVVFPDFHSDLEKSFLGTTIPAGTSGEDSIDLALDALVDHPNTPPFVSRQLIQRLVTSDPDPAYVERVADAFATGGYELENGTVVGDGRRGDLAATVAAILFDEAARSDAARQSDSFGKVREPVLRFTNWARAFDVDTITPRLARELWNTADPSELGQHPYKAPSVFNFYRPGYIPPASEVGDAGLTAPEFQIVNSSSIAGYTNFMTTFILGNGADNPDSGAFVPDYTEEIALADDPGALVDHLDRLLTFGTMSDETKTGISEFVSELPISSSNDPDESGRTLRAQLAILLVMTSPDYVIQR